MSRDRTAPGNMPGGRLIAMPAGMMVGLMGLVGCAAEAEDPPPRESYAAVSATESEAPDGPGLLDQDEIAELLLDEDEFPFSPVRYVEEVGPAYFHEHIAVVGDSYTGNFGDDLCAAQMDSINELLVGEAPQSGVFRAVTGEIDGREGTFYVWMLSHEDPVDTGAIWDSVLHACDGHTLESETDVIDLSAVDHLDFRGLAMEMSANGGDEGLDVDGFSATRDLGNSTLMISAVHVDAVTFGDVVQAQSEKLEERLSAEE